MILDLAFVLIAMCFSVVTAIRPFRIGKMPINMVTGSAVIMAALLLTRIIDIQVIQTALLGTQQLRPWEILVIFFTVAYVSISVDVTGIFDFLAYTIVRRAQGDGVRLFFYLYLFASLLTVFTSNDIVILTLTPIIFYLGKHAKLNVVPLLFAEFFGANTLSMLLYIGNPTNIIMGNALGLGFLEYTRVMWLPTLVAALSTVLLLSVVFRSGISKRFSVNEESTFSVHNWGDALISSVLLLAMLGTLTISQALTLPIWKVTLTASSIFIIKDLLLSLFYSVKGGAQNGFGITVTRIPWAILPFITVFFVLVGWLDQVGVVDTLARLIARFSPTPGSSIAVHGALGLILANVINNQPMTILLSNVFINDSLPTTGPAYRGGAYAVIIASNLGANVTLIGSLAGLIWRKILKSKGFTVGYVDFLKTGLLVTPVVVCLTLMTLWFVIGGAH